MRKSSLAARVLGLGVVSLLTWGLAGAASAQDGTKAAAPAAPSAAGPIRIGSIDMDRVFKEYKKVKFASDQLKQDALAKQAELQKMMKQMRDLADQAQSLDPSSNDAKAKQTEMTKLKAQLEAERENAQAEFARREAEALATIYKEVQSYTTYAAKQMGFTFVVKVSAEPVTGNDPNSVMAAMARSVVYYDPSTDLTPTVIKWLNDRYDQQINSGAAPRPAAPKTGSTATADPATQPASASRPASAPRR